MKTHITFIAGTSLLLMGASGAPSLEFSSDSMVWLVGESNLHPFTSKSTKIKISTTLKQGPTEDFADALQSGLVKDFTVNIPVKTLKSGDGLLDSNLYRAMNAESHPTIRFDMSRFKVKQTGPKELTLQATGRLSIAGKEREVDLLASGTVVEGKIRVKGEQSLNMSEFGINPPTILLGSVKVKDKIIVHYDLLGYLR
jgi:polyisoprenoid-binding protein YceI